MNARLGFAFAIALEGLRGTAVEIETKVSQGMPTFVLIGLPDASLGEARDRLRAALASAGCALPVGRVTTNMLPASLRKHGSGFDLAIAASVLAATGVVDAAGPARAVHLGEVSLAGAVRRVAGVLPATAAAREAGFDRVVVPLGCGAEAGLVEGIEVTEVASLRELALHYGADADDLAPAPSDGAKQEAPRGAAGTVSVAVGVERTEPGRDRSPSNLDFAQVAGNATAIRALVIAAAGGHHALMIGPPGSGKSMLAERLPSILPPLEVDEAIEVAALRSLCGLQVPERLDRRRPFEAPHHSASAVALIGGGSGAIRPGAISLAAHGVLFLDEAPEFPRRVLDALRQPLESGSIEVHRANARAVFPANAQLLLAANPCPCGNASGSVECRCSPQQRRLYLARLSGPLLDRIDLQLTIERVTAVEQRVHRDCSSPGTASAELAAAVLRARERSAARLAGTPWRCNAELPSAWLLHPSNRPDREALIALDRAFDRGLLTMRGYVRVLRCARTIADLEGSERCRAEHVAEALFFRTGVRDDRSAGRAGVGTPVRAGGSSQGGAR